MIKKPKLLFFFVLLMAFAVNSCKKDDTSVSLTKFLTRDSWKLALKQRFAYVNNVLVKTDTLETACALRQTVTFATNNTYTYINYACAKSTINAPWTFTSDHLYLNLNSVISVNSADKQNVAHIITLGQYSLVFDTGDVGVSPKSTTDSIIVFRYGFIH